jgi:hypothetical protein
MVNTKSKFELVWFRVRAEKHGVSVSKGSHFRNLLYCTVACLSGLRGLSNYLQINCAFLHHDFVRASKDFHLLRAITEHTLRSTHLVLLLTRSCSMDRSRRPYYDHYGICALDRSLVNQ